MNIPVLALSLVIGVGSLNSDPCPARWQDCAIPWPIPLVPYVPDVTPVAVDLTPAEDVEGPVLDSLPELDVPELTVPETLEIPEFPAPDDPEEEEEDITAQVNAWLLPISSLRDALEDWIGETGSLPDASEGDFATGFEDIDEESEGSAFTFAISMGSNISLLFQYARALSSLSLYSIGTMVLFIMGCAAWLALNRFIVFALSIADMLWSVLAQGVQALGEALPWPW